MKAPSPTAASSAGRTPIDAPTAASGPPLVSLDAAIFKDVQVALQARLGDASISVADLLALKAGSVVSLEARLTDLVDLHLNGAVVARGEIVAVDDHFGVRIVEIAEVK